MSVLTLVRHGQASFMSDDYDRLSPLGERQAQLLGRYWLERNLRPDRVYTGPKRRQRHTAAIVSDVFAAAHRSWPTVEVLDELDEVQADVAFQRALPTIRGQDPDIDALMAVLEDKTRSGYGRAMQLLFQKISTRWVRGEIPLPPEEVEPWSVFCERVARAVTRMRGGSTGEHGQHVIAFTSAGTTSAVVQQALTTRDDLTFELALIIRNASLTEFLYSEGRLTLSTFNNTPHLDDPALITYR